MIEEKKPIWTPYGSLAVKLEYALPYLRDARSICIGAKLDLTAAQIDNIISEVGNLYKVASEINKEKTRDT